MKNKITDILREYLEAPEAWSDNVQIEVDTAAKTLRLVDDDNIDEESDTYDYWPVMDFISMSVDAPGAWQIDMEAVEEMAAEYE